MPYMLEKFGDVGGFLNNKNKNPVNPVNPVQISGLWGDEFS